MTLANDYLGTIHSGSALRNHGRMEIMDYA
jgi:hypothetical protein